MRGEREQLTKMVESKTAALEESRASQETMAKKMRLREKRIKQLEEERVQVRSAWTAVIIGVTGW